MNLNFSAVKPCELEKDPNGSRLEGTGREHTRRGRNVVSTFTQAAEKFCAWVHARLLISMTA